MVTSIIFMYVFACRKFEIQMVFKQFSRNYILTPYRLPRHTWNIEITIVTSINSHVIFFAHPTMQSAQQLEQSVPTIRALEKTKYTVTRCEVPRIIELQMVQFPRSIHEPVHVYIRCCSIPDKKHTYLYIKRRSAKSSCDEWRFYRESFSPLASFR